MTAGGVHHGWLERLRRERPFSLHGVGLSLGGAEALDREHLAALRGLVERYEPGLVSEHLAWCRRGGKFFNDLLPVPLCEESLAVVARHVEETQEALGRRILVENPSVYLGFEDSWMSEPAFLGALCRRAGCGLLLDVNNVHVSAMNGGMDASAYLDAVETEFVGEVHVAGHAVERLEDGSELRIDDHGSFVGDEVWGLLERFLGRCGAVPVLVEWDTNVPSLDVLLAEAGKAEQRLAGCVGG